MTIAPRAAFLAMLHTAVGVLLAWLGLHLWVDCGKDCRLADKPATRVSTFHCNQPKVKP